MLVLALTVVNEPVPGLMAPMLPLKFDAVQVVTLNVVNVPVGALTAVLTDNVPVMAALPVTLRPVPTEVHVTEVNVPAAGTPPPIAGGLDR